METILSNVYLPTSFKIEGLPVYQFCIWKQATTKRDDFIIKRKLKKFFKKQNLRSEIRFRSCNEIFVKITGETSSPAIIRENAIDLLNRFIPRYVC